MARCKICKTEFRKLSIKHKVCSAECAIVFNQQEKERKAAKETRKKKIDTRTRAEWVSIAQREFNAFIRERDKGPCISCGRHHQGQYHAGHYLSTGARPELRFTESNCHKQCQPCNTHLSGNIALYRINLIKKVGLAEVERLEGPHPPKKWGIEELKEICQLYRAKLKELKSQ